MPASQLQAKANVGAGTDQLMTFDDGAGGAKAGGVALVTKDAAPIDAGNPLPVAVQSGPGLTNAQLRAAPVPVSGNISAAMTDGGGSPYSSVNPLFVSVGNIVGVGYVDQGGNSGSLVAANDAVVYTRGNAQASLVVTISGTYSATIVIEAEYPGGAWAPIRIIADEDNVATSGNIVLANATKRFRVNIAAVSRIRARAVSVASGTVNVAYAAFMAPVDIPPLTTGAATEATLTALNTKTPALGVAAPAASSPVTLPNDVVVSAGALIAAVNTDLLTGAVSGWYDAANFHSASIQIIGGAGITAGQIIFEQTNDIVAGNVWPVDESTSLTPTPNVAALAIASNTTRMFGGAVTARYVRVRVSTAFTGGDVRAVAVFSQLPYFRPVQTVHQAAAANLNVTASGTVSTNTNAGTNAIGDVGVQYRANATGAASQANFVAAATTNPTVIKASAGRLIGYHLTNNATAVRYVKLHNSATAPTAGAGVVGTIGIPPNGGTVALQLPGGIAFTTGIAITTVTGAAANDATAVAANDIVGTLFFA